MAPPPPATTTTTRPATTTTTLTSSVSLPPGVELGTGDIQVTLAWDTLADLEGISTSLLSVRNDVDRYEDIKGNPVFEPFLTQKKP